MRGLPGLNFPAFHEAAAALRSRGYAVFNPAERDEAKHGKSMKDFSLREALADDTQYICLTADAIALLPGWEKSKGALAEKALAEALGHNVIFLQGGLRVVGG